MPKPGLYAAILFAFEKNEGEVKVLVERHYKLVDANELTAEDLAAYRRRI